jgi:hypothetical protein
VAYAILESGASQFRIRGLLSTWRIFTAAHVNEATTPPKLIPPFHSTAASGMFPTEHTKEIIATKGPIIGPQNQACVGLDYTTATTFAIPAWAGPVGTGRTAPEAQGSSAQNQVSPELIAKLQEASDEAAQVGRHGGIKNNPG